MSEIALVSARKFKLENSAKKGNSNARQALQLANNPNTFLSTVQIGITLIGILTGIFSGEKIEEDLNAAIAGDILDAPIDGSTVARLWVKGKGRFPDRHGDDRVVLRRPRDGRQHEDPAPMAKRLDTLSIDLKYCGCWVQAGQRAAARLTTEGCRAGRTGAAEALRNEIGAEAAAEDGQHW